MTHQLRPSFLDLIESIDRGKFAAEPMEPTPIPSLERRPALLGRRHPPDEEIVPFDDYSPEFRTEAQASRPRVKAFDLRRLTSWATPSEEFFAFHQTETINADARTWRLDVAGLVERPAAFSLADLTRRVDRRDVPATIECSGNSG